jgi:hypothetical protein
MSTIKDVAIQQSSTALGIDPNVFDDSNTPATTVIDTPRVQQYFVSPYADDLPLPAIRFSGVGEDTTGRCFEDV